MNAANALSLARGAVGIVLAAFVIAVPYASPLYLLAFAVFAAAALSDAADGAVARRAGTTSALGAFLDPLADKVLVLGVLLPPRHGPFDGTLLAVVVAREALVVGLRAALLARGTALPATLLAKAKTSALAGAAGAHLLAFATMSFGLIVASWALLAAGALLGIVSLPAYLVPHRRRHAS